MLKKIFFCFGAAFLFAACSGNAQKSPDGKHYGAMINADNAMRYDDLIPKMATVDSMPAKVVGKVSAVCQKKGCWMMLTPEQSGLPDMRVRFKDYAFFMPKDLSGKRVVIDGFAYVDVTPVEELRHYAEDAGKSKAEIEAINQPKREVAFEASGVLILD